MQPVQKKQIKFVNIQSQEIVSLFEVIKIVDNKIDISNAVASFNMMNPIEGSRLFKHEGIVLNIKSEQQYYIENNSKEIEIQYEDQSGDEGEGEGGKQRSKQRTIREVLIGVKKWRNLHESKGSKRLSLQEAAIEVGFSKKSLDDYYSQLRLAQTYGFEFVKNLDEKIGSLRNFVKLNRKSKKKSKKKHQKLSKQLLAIQLPQLQQQLPPTLEQANSITPSIKQSALNIPIQLSHDQQVQNQYYQDLFMMDTELIDPFVPFRSYNFRDSEFFPFQ